MSHLGKLSHAFNILLNLLVTKSAGQTHFFFFYPLTFSEIILSFIIITLFKFCWGKKNKKQKNAFQINKQQVPTVTTCLLLHIAWHNMSCHRNKLICMLSQKVSVCWLIVPYFLGNNSDNVDSKVCVYAETDL